MQEKNQIQYEDIDLMDYMRVILKRKGIIVAFFILGLILALSLNYFSTRVYKATTVLEISTKEKEALQTVKKIENNVYQSKIKQSLNIEEYPKIKAESFENTNLVKIEIKSENPQKAKMVLEELNNLILKEHQQEIEKEKQNIEEDINALKQELNFIKNQRLTSEGIAKLKIEIINLKNKLQDFTPTKIIKEPTISGPTKPRKKINLALGAIIGLFLGLCAAFCAEWWQNNKERL